MDAEKKQNGRGLNRALSTRGTAYSAVVVGSGLAENVTHHRSTKNSGRLTVAGTHKVPTGGTVSTSDIRAIPHNATPNCLTSTHPRHDTYNPLIPGHCASSLCRCPLYPAQVPW